MLFQNLGFLHWSAGLMRLCFGIAKEVTQLWGSVGQCCQSKPPAWGRKQLLVILYCLVFAELLLVKRAVPRCGLAAECDMWCPLFRLNGLSWLLEIRLVEKALAMQTWGLEFRFPESTCAGQVWHLTVNPALQRQKWCPCGQFKIGRSCDLWAVGSSEKPYIKKIKWRVIEEDMT